MTRDVRHSADPAAAAYEAEAAVAELTELLESQTAEIARLRRELETSCDERERLETELALARGWVKELGARLDEAEARLAGLPSTLRSRIAAAQAPAA